MTRHWDVHFALWIRGRYISFGVQCWWADAALGAFFLAYWLF
jgi:hypothetical protein